MSATTPINPKYLSGKGHSVIVTYPVSGTDTPFQMPTTGFTADELCDTWDASNANEHGYDYPEASNGGGCKITFTSIWKKTGGAPKIKKGFIYPLQLNTQQVSGGATPVYEGFSGNALITGISTKALVKGGTMYDVSAVYQGVYNSPEYPTAIADSTATPPVGDFTPPA